MKFLTTNERINGYEVLLYRNGLKPQKQNLLKAKVSERKLNKEVFVHDMFYLTIEDDFVSPIILEIKPDVEWESVKIRPENKLEYTITKDNSVKIEISNPIKFSLEFDGEIYENLFVFAHAPDSNKPNPNDSNVIYFGAGEHFASDIVLESNQTLYLDSNAFVFGKIVAKNAENIKIAGYGTLCGSKENHTGERPYHILLENCKNANIENILMIDSPCWSVVTKQCEKVSINGINQISYNWNSDGFDICGTQNVEISNVFLRNFDDNISIKSFGGDSKNIIMRDSVLWCDCAHNMLVGPEADLKNGTVFENIVFENIDVLESREYADTFMGVMAIMCADQADIKNVSWKDIRVERLSHGKLINVIYVNEYAQEYGKRVSDICFENIYSPLGVDSPINICGMDEDRIVENIKIQNSVLNGVPFKDVNLICKNDFVKDILVI